jgi:DNA-binding LytR/AlgR family response regulator
MKRTTIYYLDDDEKNIEYFLSLAANHNELEVIGYTGDYKKALTDIKQNKPDIVVIDIELPEITGFQFAEIVQQICPHLVFLTCHTEFAMDAYKFDPLHYLIKPIGSLDLTTILNRYQKRQQLPASTTATANEQIVVNTLKSFEFINCSDIVFIQSMEGYSHFNTVLEEKKIISSKNLKHYEMKLQGNADFYRIHKSFIINRKMLKKIVKGGNNNYNFIFKNGESFAVSSFSKEMWLEEFEG